MDLYKNCRRHKFSQYLTEGIGLGDRGFSRVTRLSGSVSPFPTVPTRFRPSFPRTGRRSSSHGAHVLGERPGSPVSAVLSGGAFQGLSSMAALKALRLPPGTPYSRCLAQSLCVGTSRPPAESGAPAARPAPCQRVPIPWDGGPWGWGAAEPSTRTSWLQDQCLKTLRDSGHLVPRCSDLLVF